jgi:hypothetical protein
MRARVLIKRSIEIGIAVLAAWLLWSSFETGRQASFGKQSKFGVSLQFWNGRIGVLYQASKTMLPGGNFTVESLAAPSYVFDDDRIARSYSGKPPVAGAARLWKFCWQWQPAQAAFTRGFDTFEADGPGWPLAALLAMPLATRVARRRRVLIRRQHGECVACGYLVRELPTCPECGTTVTAAPNVLTA